LISYLKKDSVRKRTGSTGKELFESKRRIFSIGRPAVINKNDGHQATRRASNPIREEATPRERLIKF
jgi:hypothetical protein